MAPCVVRGGRSGGGGSSIGHATSTVEQEESRLSQEGEVLALPRARCYLKRLQDGMTQRRV